MTGIPSRFELQDAQYEFPYHYVPTLAPFAVHRVMGWGLEYVTYTSFVAHLIETYRPTALLDVGCGDGRLLHEVKGKLPHVTGIDMSERAVALARAMNPELTVTCGDVADLASRFDAIALVEVLEHIPDAAMPTFIASLRECISDTGMLFVSVPSINVPVIPKHYRHYSTDTLAATLAPSYTVEKHWWVYRRGLLERTLVRCLCNPLFVLNQPKLIAGIWSIHKRRTYMATPSTGAHLVCIARPTDHG